MIQYLSTQMIETYHQMINEKSKMVSKIIGIITISCLICFILFVTLYVLGVLRILVFPIISVSLLFVMIIVWIIVKNVFVSEKPLYVYLYPKMIEDIQYNDEYIIKYEAYPKIKELLKESSLFTKFASSTTRAGFFFTDDNGHAVTIYDTYYYTQTNNSTIVHFNGYYVIIDNIDARAIQIRTKGRPARNEVSYIKTVNEKKLKVYSEDINAESNDSVKIIFDKLNEKLSPKNLYISALDQKIYIAIDVHKPVRKLRTLDRQSYNQLRENLLKVITAINEAISNE